MQLDELFKQEEISTLLGVNVAKMHFQQNACFQIRNWALGITGIVIPLIWVGNITFQSKIYIHIFTILLMVVILNRDLSWHSYQVMYRDRARLCEMFLLGGGGEAEKFSEHYLSCIPFSNQKLLNEALLPTNLLLFRMDYIEIYLIAFLSSSLLFTVIFS